MHHHSKGAELVQEHPLLCSLPRFLRKQNGLSGDVVQFLKRQLYFAYPRTLWLKLSVEHADLTIRHSTDFTAVGAALKSWLGINKSIRHLVFDFLEVTILDIEGMASLCEAVLCGPNCPTTARILCSKETRNVLFPRRSPPETQFFEKRDEVFLSLRSISAGATVKIRLPKTLDMPALDNTLLELAGSSQLDHCDALLFDMTEVEEGNFETYSMLAPLVHSLAHERGTLASMVNASAKVQSKLVSYGSLYPMRSYFVHTPQALLQEAVPPEDHSILPLTSFVADDQIHNVCDDHLRVMLKHAVPWFGNVVGTNDRVPLTAHEFKQITILFRSLLQIVFELIENVRQHANGLGYVMMELDPRFGGGLRIYIGDTGIGLAHGISRAYRMNVRSDAKALQMIFHLVEHMQKRRNLPGHLAFGGRGLDRVRATLMNLAGKLTIRTGSAMASYEPINSIEPFGLKVRRYAIDGTHIHISIPTRTKRRP